MAKISDHSSGNSYSSPSDRPRSGKMTGGHSVRQESSSERFGIAVSVASGKKEFQARKSPPSSQEMAITQLALQRFFR